MCHGRQVSVKHINSQTVTGMEQLPLKVKETRNRTSKTLTKGKRNKERDKG